MRYTLNNELEISSARKKLESFIEKQCTVELIAIKHKRSLSQNSYLHLLFGIYGLENGWTIEEAKQVIMMELNYSYIKNGRMFRKHTSDFDVAEMSAFIDKFRNFAANQGCYLPEANETEKITQAQNYIESNKQWL